MLLIRKITCLCILNLLFWMFFSQPNCIYVPYTANCVLAIMPSNIKWSLFRQYFLSVEWNIFRLSAWQNLLRYFMSAKIFLFSTTFFKAKIDGESVLTHARSWLSCPCSHLWNNLLSSLEWIPWIWIKFSLTDFPKCCKSNWCNVSGYSPLKEDLIWKCWSVVSVVIFIGPYHTKGPIKSQLSVCQSVCPSFSSLFFWGMGH